jgi:methylmalonyl-CoA mutase N-terminal domain/subunit
VERLAKVKLERDDERVSSALAGIAECLREEGNVVPTVIAAVWEYATVGEICGVFRQELEEWRPGQEF